MLVFPAKTANTQLSGLSDRDHDCLPRDSAATHRRLTGCDVLQRFIGNRLYKAVPKNTERHPEGANVLAQRSVFLSLGAYRPVVHQRPIWNAVLPMIDEN